MKWKNQPKLRRENLMKKDPHCYWCGVEVIYYRLIKHEKVPDNFATLDHLHTRYTLAVKRATAGQHKPVTVLACWKCNNERGKKETESMPREELWKRAHSYPVGHPLKTDYREEQA